MMPKGIPNKPRAKKATTKKANRKKATNKSIQQLVEEALEKAERKRVSVEVQEPVAIATEEVVETLDQRHARVAADVGRAVASGVVEQLDEVELEVLLPIHEIENLTKEEPSLVLIPIVLSREPLNLLYPAYWTAYYPSRAGDPPPIDSPAGKKFLREFFTSNLRGMLLEDSHKIKAPKKLGV